MKTKSLFQFVAIVSLAFLVSLITGCGSGGGGGGGGNSAPARLPFMISSTTAAARDCFAVFNIDKTDAYSPGTALTVTTADGTAVAGNDYEPISETGTPGVADFPFAVAVPLIRNPSAADGRTFTLTVTSPTDAFSSISSTATLSATEAAFSEGFDSGDPVPVCSRRWDGRIFERSVANGKLNLRLAAYNRASLPNPPSAEKSLIQSSLYFGAAPMGLDEATSVANSQEAMGSIRGIRADVAMTGADVTNGLNTQARIAGDWYLGGPASSGCGMVPNCIDRTNDVSAAIAVRNSDLIAYAVLCNNLDCTETTTLRSETLLDGTTTPAYVLGTEYTIAVQYDPTTSALTFSAASVGGGTPATATFTPGASGMPAVISATPQANGKHIGIGFHRARYGEGGDATASFDNVYVDTGGGFEAIYEDFDSLAVVDPSKWSSVNQAAGVVNSIVTGSNSIENGALRMVAGGAYINGAGFSYFVNSFATATDGGLPIPLHGRKISATLNINSIAVTGSTAGTRPNARAGLELRYQAGQPYAATTSSRDQFCVRLSGVVDTLTSLRPQLQVFGSTNANFTTFYGSAPATVMFTTPMVVGISYALSLEETAPGTWVATVGGETHIISVSGTGTAFDTAMVPANFAFARLIAQVGNMTNGAADTGDVDASFSNITVGK